MKWVVLLWRRSSRPISGMKQMVLVCTCSSVPVFHEVLQQACRFFVGMVGFGVAGKRTRLNIGEEALQGFGGSVGQVGILAHEAGEVVGVHSQHVVEDEDLPVAMA